MLRYLPLIVKNSMRSKRRSLLTVASAAISLCLLGILMAIYNAFYVADAPPQQALLMVTRNRISPAIKLPLEYENRIRHVPGVREVMPLQYFGGTYQDPKNIFGRYAVDCRRVFLIHPDHKISEEQNLAFQREKRGAVAGKTLAGRFGWKIGERITLKGDFFPVTVDLILVGTYESSLDENMLLFRIDYLFDLVQARLKDRVFAFEVQAESAELVPRISGEIDELFRNSPAQTKTEAERAYQLSFVSMMGNVKGFLASISVALTFTLLLVTANTMAMSARERVREVGVLKTLGFSTVDILGMILGESAFLALIGGVIGCGFAWILISLVGRLPVVIVPLTGMNLNAPLAALLILVGVAIELASALIPAWSVARTPILQALRSSD
jgi:putative ABC transport system permease protein